MVNSDAMIEVQERRGFSSVKEAIRLRRFIKELANEEDIDLRGRRGQRLGGILDRTDQVLSELEVEHADWIEQKRQLLAGYLSPVKPVLAEEAYKGGLAITITQEFRTYGRVSKEETVKLDDPKYLRGVITGYTVDFLHSLRLSERLGINPNIALEVARLSYHYNPTKLIRLIRQYPDINLSTIQTAALSYPKNPEAFLDGFIANVAKLSADPKYADLNLSVINSAALIYPKNPGVFLDGFIANVAKLTEKYPDIPKSIITLAALYFSGNPEAYVEKAKTGKAPTQIPEAEELAGIVSTEITEIGEEFLPPQYKDE